MFSYRNTGWLVFFVGVIYITIFTRARRGPLGIRVREAAECVPFMNILLGFIGLQTPVCVDSRLPFGIVAIWAFIKRDLVCFCGLHVWKLGVTVRCFFFNTVNGTCCC